MICHYACSHTVWAKHQCILWFFSTTFCCRCTGSHILQTEQAREWMAFSMHNLVVICG